MVWTKVTRARYRRIGVGYASDMSDAEWAIVAAHLPVPSRLGRPRRTSPRCSTFCGRAARGAGCPATFRRSRRCSITFIGGAIRGGGAGTPANVQDSQGAVPLLKALACKYPALRLASTDRIYRGAKLLAAVANPCPWTIEIITRSQSVGHFVPEPRRWVVERTFAWLGRNRRLAKDYEASPRSQEAWVNLASIKTLSRQLARAQL